MIIVLNVGPGASAEGDTVDYDAIVIGSGAGGLTAALCLAQAGQKVLVLEQHYVPGGWCHSFTLGGYRFSPGVHYIGELAPGGRMRRICEGLGVANDLTFLELNPEGYDHVLIGEERFDIPKGKEKYAERLKRRFPAEARGIDGYLGVVDRIARGLNAALEVRGVRDALALPFRVSTVARYGLLSHERVLRGFIRDPLLRAILSIQAGDHGLPPSRAPAALHAAVMAHYFEGGFYPRGGGFAIPRAFHRALRRAGGEVRVRSRVARILIQGRRAIGVRLDDGTEIRARHVISNADPHMTYRQLVGEEHLSGRLRRQLRRTRYSVSALSLFLAVDMDVRARGLDSGNYWYSSTERIDDMYRLDEITRTEELPGLFLTVTTLKDPTKSKNGHHTMEAFCFVSYDSFQHWAQTRYGERPEGYAAMKRELQARMLRAAGRIVPGIEDHVVFCDLGTPLTNVHYVAATEGNLYGTEKSLTQMGPFGYGIESEIPGLSMCGASTVGHGVLGATISGLVAAKQILRCRTSELLRARGQELHIYPSDDTSGWPESLRSQQTKEKDERRAIAYG
jgi:phytoene dehydrogenase-like protein